MVVRQHAAVDAGRTDNGRVIRVHPVMDALARPEVIAGGDTGFQIDDAQVGGLAVQHPQCIAPDIFEVDRPGDGPVGFFRDLHVAERVFHVAFVDLRVARVRQHLVDPTAGHHVTCQEQRDGLSRGRWRSGGRFRARRRVPGARTGHRQQPPARRPDEIAAVHSQIIAPAAWSPEASGWLCGPLTLE
jgi:hypothetical protein